MERLRLALYRIAYDPDISCLAGNPLLWPCTIAYEALGGRIEGGVRIDVLAPPEMSDIVDRLRALATSDAARAYAPLAACMREAADEIERLREQTPTQPRTAEENISGLDIDPYGKIRP